MLVAFCAATARWILWPPEDEPGRADAVVVLAGGAGERLAEGLRLMEAGVAPTLVISHGRQPGWPEANRLCSGAAPYRVACFDPEPDRTQGEARGAAALARREGWRSLVVVTSSYHATRAGVLFRRCFRDVRVVAARPDSPGGLPSARSLTREWAGFAHAALVERDC